MEYKYQEFSKFFSFSHLTAVINLNLNFHMESYGRGLEYFRAMHSVAKIKDQILVVL